MTPKDLLINYVDPALALLAPLGVRSDQRARLLVLAIVLRPGTVWAHLRNHWWKAWSAA